MTTKLTDKNISNVSNLGISWQAVIVADGSTATSVEAGKGYFIDTTSNAHTVTLPSSPNAGDTIAIKDYAGTFATNNLTISRNGHNIQGVANNSLISTNRANVELAYIDSTKGWLYTNESNVADLEEPTFVTATGGTITTVDTNYKVHTFTGDGSFTVSQVSNISANNVVSYMVVAGGGGSNPNQSGGGGAGGYREGKSPVTPYTASPLNAPTGLTVSATGYPITVGGGGAAQCEAVSGNGSNSVFSTITSAGGGTGANRPNAGPAGGSGGGGGGCGPKTGGAGNTPPVSPSQGNAGGNAGEADGGGGGGGGAGAVGANSSAPRAAGNGGAGVSSSITGSSVARAGGGGGGSGTGTPASNQGAGGTGGGGTGGSGNVSPAVTSTDGSTNTGGGGGGGGNTPGTNISRAGGSGIVIIRYKFQ